jgi:phosphoribosylformimino-5-aminoimidazole carboxamide ribotide isomerase
LLAAAADGLRIIGVLDLRHGHAVHARAGNREQYGPVQSVAGEAIAGDAPALARIYRDRFGLHELYAADLDAIEGRAPQDPLVASLAGLAPLWLDAGVSSVDGARHALALGVAYVIIGLETLESWDALDDICAAVDRQRIAFSLDVRDGVPVGRANVVRGMSADDAAARAADAGVASIIVLDLARVGMNVGIDTGLMARVRESAAGATLLMGGGVRGPDDLVRLAAQGCDGVLVATALLDGRIGAADVAAVQSRQASFSR